MNNILFRLISTLALTVGLSTTANATLVSRLGGQASIPYWTSPGWQMPMPPRVQSTILIRLDLVLYPGPMPILGREVYLSAA